MRWVARIEWPGGNLCCTIHQLFRDSKIPNEYKRDTLGVMRALAYDSSRVPPRYLVDPGTLSVGGVVAKGAFAEVREGRLCGKRVAIKTPRTDRQASPHEIQACRI